MEDLLSAYGGRFLVAALGVALALLLLFIVLWLMRNRPSSPFVRGGRNRQPRLQVLDAAAVDARRRIVLIRRDDVEHLVMIGGPTDIVIESGIGDNRNFVNVTPAEQQQKAAQIIQDSAPPSLAQPVRPERQPVLAETRSQPPAQQKTDLASSPSQPQPLAPASSPRPISDAALLEPQPQRAEAQQSPKSVAAMEMNPSNKRSEPYTAPLAVALATNETIVRDGTWQARSKPEMQDAPARTPVGRPDLARPEPTDPKPLDVKGFNPAFSPMAGEGPGKPMTVPSNDESLLGRVEPKIEQARATEPTPPSISAPAAQDILDAARARVIGQQAPSTAPQSPSVAEKPVNREPESGAGQPSAERRNLSEFERVLEQEMEAQLDAISRPPPAARPDVAPSVSIMPDRPSLPMAAVLPTVRPDPLADLPVDSPASPEKKDAELQNEIAKIFGDISASRN
ncbi:flagellar biosynthetic protein FliO [Peteryoungia desertarenae]|uniref:Flagellar biosynthetic protein FliO n=1 Tax=Peteryoungia desertarenae TaxID=1813451 RepID=A0ABX6QQ85_9HYPH|nr:flagellar biosynthetic protein FliO [Peteryoungia desertarenae]QLF70700.1 flagellar biosynthetic protein FliO [Peteryoungia desertarenae]